MKKIKSFKKQLSTGLVLMVSMALLSSAAFASIKNTVVDPSLGL